jgi:hypothetical protein
MGRGTQKRKWSRKRRMMKGRIRQQIDGIERWKVENDVE